MQKNNIKKKLEILEDLTYDCEELKKIKLRLTNKLKHKLEN